ncbi:hypothetical protein Taro_027081, partial [Colocasia esculenta]|nr:hypothetical protein [Colocasia esculenta]
MWTLRVVVAVGGIGVDANLRILQVRVPVFLELPTGSEGCLEDRGTGGGDESREESSWRGAIPVGACGGFGVNQEIAGVSGVCCHGGHEMTNDRQVCGSGSEGCLEDCGTCGGDESREEMPWRGAIPVGARRGFGVNQEIAGVTGVCCHGGHEMTNDRQVCGS